MTVVLQATLGAADGIGFDDSRLGGPVSQLPPPPGSDLGRAATMPFAPPPPGSIPPPYHPIDRTASRWTADSNQARLTIPYLGTEPRPSKLTAMMLLGACGAAAAMYLVRAVLYLRVGSLEQSFLDQPSASRLADADSAARLVSSLGPVILLAVALIVVLDLVWRVQRRPKQARTELGEAYVEHPLTWITPVALRVLWAVLLVGAVAAGMAGSITRTTAAADYPHHRQLLALGNVGWAAVWVTLGAWVLLANRSHARRLAFSGPYRADPSSVPFFPAVGGSGAFDTSGSSSGLGWVLRTAGLTFAAIVGLVMLIGGVADLTGGRPSGLGWTAAGGGILALVVWAGVRRRQRARAPGA
jgi:hypothetical protein